MQEGQSCGQGIGESGTGPRSCTESKRTTTLSGLILCPIPTNPYSSYNPGPLLFHHVPEVTQVEAHCNQMPYVHYRQQQPQSIKNRMPSVLNPVSHQDTGKFCSQVLTRSMVRKSEVAVPCQGAMVSCGLLASCAGLSLTAILGERHSYPNFIDKGLRNHIYLLLQKERLVWALPIAEWIKF